MKLSLCLSHVRPCPGVRLTLNSKTSEKLKTIRGGSYWKGHHIPRKSGAAKKPFVIGTVILNAWSRDYGKIENVNEATFELSHSVWETQTLPSPKRNILLSVKMEIKIGA